LLKGLKNIVIKEVKELIRDPRILLGIIIVPLLMYPLMGFATRAALQTAQESLKEISIAVIDSDKGIMAQHFTDFLGTYPNIKLTMINSSNIEENLSFVQESGVHAVILIPEDFSVNISSGLKGELRIYGLIRVGGFTESAVFSATNQVVQTFEQALVTETLMQGGFPDPEIVLDPVITSQKSIVKGKIIDVSPENVIGSTMSQLMFMPTGIMILIILAMQLSATAVAAEKEEKTLETLLSLPIDRFTILVGKLAGSVIVAAVGALAVVVGFTYYVGSFTAGLATDVSTDLQAIGLTPDLMGYLLLGASLFVSLICALALAMSISVFAEDVRGAQSLLGFLIIPLIIPMLFLMFADINAVPLIWKIVLFAIPFTHPMLAARASFTGDYTTAVLGIAYVTVFTLATLYVAAKIFTTEKIFTMRVRLRRRKAEEE
jgi:ABC-2 type transport system permease protein